MGLVHLSYNPYLLGCLFSGNNVFSLTTNQPEQCFSLFFQPKQVIIVKLFDIFVLVVFPSKILSYHYTHFHIGSFGINYIKSYDAYLTSKPSQIKKILKISNKNVKNNYQKLTLRIITIAGNHKVDLLTFPLFSFRTNHLLLHSLFFALFFKR